MTELKKEFMDKIKSYLNRNLDELVERPLLLNSVKIPLVVELETLGKTIKILEEECPAILDPTKYTILRVDGHKFSTFTKRFRTKRDQGMIDAMISAAKSWLNEFQGITAYVQSDECTLLLAPVNPEVPGAKLLYGGRTSKLISLSAGYFSTKFNASLPEQYRGFAYFDCRAFQVGTVQEVWNVFRWRQLDAFRNGTSTLIRMVNSRKEKPMNRIELEKLSTKQRVDLFGDDEIKYAGDHIVHGTFVKKELLTLTNPDTQKEFQRTETKPYVFGTHFVIVTPTATWLTEKYSTLRGKSDTKID
jgi:hypothetical protein